MNKNTRHCPRCGEEIADGSNFCEYCGKKVGGKNLQGVSEYKEKERNPIWRKIMAFLTPFVATLVLFRGYFIFLNVIFVILWFSIRNNDSVKADTKEFSMWSCIGAVAVMVLFFILYMIGV